MVRIFRDFGPRYILNLMTNIWNIGLQQFRAFLGRCSKGNDVSDEDMGENLKILKEWLEAQSRGASDGDMGEGQGNAFTGILQVWSYASQVYTTIALFLLFIFELTNEGSDLE